MRSQLDKLQKMSEEESLIKRIHQNAQRVTAFLSFTILAGLLFVSPVFSQANFNYSNATPIVITDNSTASVYPSEIGVSGLNPSTVQSVSVQLRGFSHSFPDDVDIILVGPTGAQSILMSDAGGSTDVNDISFFFTSPGSTLPDVASLSNGSAYQPANYDVLNDNFPAPGPGVASGTADLSIFNGLNPNGTWRLFIVDDSNQDAGEITGGWRLLFDVDEVTATVTKTADTDDGACDADCSLREAINSNPTAINFSPLFDTQQTITLGGTQLEINSSVVITGPGADKLTVSGDNASRVFKIGGFKIVAISGMTISDGNTSGFGGGIESDSSLSLFYVTVSGNNADFGGGVAVAFAGFELWNCTISDNTAAVNGGGVEYQGNGYQNNLVYLSTISGNTATNVGGGISNSNNSGDGRLTIVYSTIFNNNATSTGGGIRTHTDTDPNATVTTQFGNSIIANNAPNNLFEETTGGGARVITSLGFNLSDDDNGFFTEPTDIDNVDPMLAPLGNYGGTTQTHALRSGSPAIDAGLSNLLGDQRDRPGLVDDPNTPNAPNGNGSDIGAFERQTFGNTQTFTNNTSITITNDDGGGTAASSYPSVLNMASLGGSQVISKVTVSLNSLTHTFPDDLDIILEAPSGQMSYLMSDAGDDLNVNGINLTFDQDAAQEIPNSTILTSGTFKPANYEGTTNDTFPAPGPSDVSSITADLGVFNGTDPNGDWKLYIVDDTNADFGTLSGGWTINFELTDAPNPTGSTKFDFDGDSKTDISIFRPNLGQWWYLRSSDLGNAAFAFGTDTDTLVPADFTGDGKTDIAFWRETTGEWFILRSEDSSFFGFPFGTAGDIPAPGDFDGDGKADAAVFRPSSSTWFIQRSSDGGTTIQGFGATEDKPTVADYDGDGKDDIAIYRPSVSQWWQFRSTDGTIAYQFGTAGDKTIQGDYTGDGKADVGVFRPSTGQWLILRSEDSSFFGFPFGTATDIPSPGDYDGDGTFDAAVFRPSTNTWFYNGSTSGNVQLNFGVAGDVPIPNVYSVE